MRKRYKQKSKSLCGMCKDYKTGHALRWTKRELDARMRHEQVARAILKGEGVRLPDKIREESRSE